MFAHLKQRIATVNFVVPVPPSALMFWWSANSNESTETVAAQFVTVINPSRPTDLQNYAEPIACSTARSGDRADHGVLPDVPMFSRRTVVVAETVTENGIEKICRNAVEQKAASGGTQHGICLSKPHNALAAAVRYTARRENEHAIICRRLRHGKVEDEFAILPAKQNGFETTVRVFTYGSSSAQYEEFVEFISHLK